MLWIKRSFLGKIYQRDKVFSYGIILLICFYSIIHIIKLEVFPFYMFAMFSSHHYAQHTYDTYVVQIDNEKVDFNKLDYRKFIHIHNAINQFDDIKVNGNIHPESQAINKFSRKLNIEGSALASWLKAPHTYDPMSLDRQMSAWIQEMINKEGSVEVYRNGYAMYGAEAVLIKSKMILDDKD